MLPLPRARHEILCIMARLVDARVGMRPFLVLLGIKGIARGVDGVWLTLLGIVSEIPVAGVHYIDSRQAEHSRVGGIGRRAWFHRPDISLQTAVDKLAVHPDGAVFRRDCQRQRRGREDW